MPAIGARFVALTEGMAVRTEEGLWPITYNSADDLFPQHEPLGAVMNLDFVFKTVASSRRRQILEWLAAPTKHFPPQRDGDLVKDGVCGVLIARKLKISQPTASDHLNMMVQAGFLQAKRIKQWTFYKRDERAIGQIRRAIGNSF